MFAPPAASGQRVADRFHAGLRFPQARSGKASGELLVRGPWIIANYFKGEGGDPLVDGWFPTGDVSTIDADVYLQIATADMVMFKLPFKLADPYAPWSVTLGTSALASA